MKDRRWYLVEIEGEYYAEKEIVDNRTGKVRKKLFCDITGTRLNLSNDKDFALAWIDARNKIEKTI
jgi:fructose-1,6-bisphosphatase